MRNVLIASISLSLLLGGAAMTAHAAATAANPQTQAKVAQAASPANLKAQAAGVPVLASNVGGVPETLDPGVTGVLLPPGNVDAWRMAILEMCDSSRRLPMGKAAQEFVREHFGTSVIAAEFVKQLTTAIVPNPGGTGIDHHPH
ncbi:MAG: glycosyltransferase [Rhodanobacter sp.]